MPQVPPEVITANRISALFWMFIVTVIFFLGQWWPTARDYRAKLISQWQPALVIALLYFVSRGLGGFGFSGLSAIGIFSQALIGLAIAHTLPGHEPLPVSAAIARQDQPKRAVGLWLIYSVALGIVIILVNGFGLSLLWQIIGEPVPSGSTPDLFPREGWKVFLLLLAGAGIAEETLYRLLCIPLFWKLSGKPWIGIGISALIFGAYHLSPLDALYRSYWQAPATTFVGVTLVGVLWGYAYFKRGYETTVLGHVFGDWAAWFLSAV